MKQLIFSILIAFFFLLGFNSVLAAPVGESGGEIWIDGPADLQPGSDPNNPDAAVDKSGRSIFVWDGTPPGTGTRKDIFFRIFPADGDSPTDPVQVNTYVTAAQSSPRVAVSGDGSFLVVWQSYEPDPNVNVDRVWVRSQAYDAAGESDGVEQLLSEHTSGETSGYADVAALRGGGYVVVWKSRQADGTGGPDIWIRRVGADGVPLADQYVANSTVGKSENYSAVTELADGGFLVVWATTEVYGRQFTADGTPVGDDFQINTFTAGAERETDVVLHEDGRVLVIWQDLGVTGESDDLEIRARLFSQDLATQGVDFQINTLVTGNQNDPAAADYGQGGFFVVWNSAVSAGNDIDGTSVEGRIVTGRDQFTGPQFLVNSWTVGAQQFPGIGGKGGRIAVGWHAKSNPVTTVNVINGQFWSICGIFCDSFEGEVAAD